MLAIEGEKDDISGIGQTKAALTVATALPDAEKKYFLAPGAGHYGIFNGSKWRNTHRAGRRRLDRLAREVSEAILISPTD